MARNIERDEREASRRKKQLIEAGFKLFSTNGIDNVSMRAVAQRADVGPATMYNYYKTKANLLVAISGYIWKKVWDEMLSNVSMDKMMRMDAYQLIVQYTDTILRLYKTHPDILRFSGNYKTFIVREGVGGNQLEEHLSVLDPIGKLFHIKYGEAQTNQCIRTDIPEHEMFTTITLTMLGMAERYSEGIVWADNQKPDHIKELEYTKEMILLWVKAGK